MLSFYTCEGQGLSAFPQGRAALGCLSLVLFWAVRGLASTPLAHYFPPCWSCHWSPALSLAFLLSYFLWLLSFLLGLSFPEKGWYLGVIFNWGSQAQLAPA